ncbi:MAG: hypothetical protein ACRDOH_36520, partial [Streptosporangiaceae bacterium]
AMGTSLIYSSRRYGVNFRDVFARRARAVFARRARPVVFGVLGVLGIFGVFSAAWAYRALCRARRAPGGHAADFVSG